MQALSQAAGRVMMVVVGCMALACTHTQTIEPQASPAFHRSASVDRQLQAAPAKSLASAGALAGPAAQAMAAVTTTRPVAAPPPVVGTHAQTGQIGIEDHLLDFAGDAEAKARRERQAELIWEDIVHSNETKFEPNPLQSDESLALTPEQMSALPKYLHRNRPLALLALSRALVAPQIFHGGILGDYGTGRLFATTTQFIQDYDRLYWVMVQVLSEKYGCFMLGKIEYGESTEVRCRDERRIFFWKSRGRGWIQFVARQFDREGYEIRVKNRQVVRISKERMI